MNEREKIIDSIKKLGYTEGSAGYMTDDDVDNGNFTWRAWQIPHSNFQLKDTPFYYNNPKDFIHFTSIDALYSILNDKHIRLYSLANMDDKFELEYAKQELLFRSDVDKAKRELYCLSMCSSGEVLNDERREHLLWKLHGRNGKGVMLRLSFEDNMDLWYDYYLAKMFYNSNNFESIKQLHKETNNEYLDPTLACLLKLPIYEFENEVRLVFNNQNSIQISKHGGLKYPIGYLHKDDTHDTKYFQLPLLNFFSNDNEIFKPFFSPLDLNNFVNELPKIKIDAIILGYRYNNEEIADINTEIRNYNLDIDVGISTLKKYF